MLKEYTIPKKGPSSWTKLPLLKIRFFTGMFCYRGFDLLVRRCDLSPHVSVFWTSSDPYPNTFSCTYTCTCELKTSLYLLIISPNPLKEVITKHVSTTKLTHFWTQKSLQTKLRFLASPFLSLLDLRTLWALHIAF